MFCTKCGTQIPDEAAFCPNCGAPAGRETGQATPEPMAPKKNNQKMIIIGVCCAVVVVAAAIFGIVRLFGASSKGVAADSDTDVVTEANARTEEAYIERLEAYQAYYDSVKDEDEDYEVLAAISLDEDNLPVLWLVFADKDTLEKDDDNLYKNYDGYFRLYGYEKKEVTLLAETSKYTAKNMLISMSTNDLFFAIYDSDGGAFYKYDYNGKFEKLDGSAELSNLEQKRYLLEMDESTGVITYYAYWLFYEGSEEDSEDSTEDDEVAAAVTDNDIIDGGVYLWDGSEISEDELNPLSGDSEKKFTLWANRGFVLGDNDFDLLIRDLKNNPIYDINMLAIKYAAISYGWEYNIEYTVEYLDLDSLNELIIDAKVDSILAAIEETEIHDLYVSGYGYYDEVNIDLDQIAGYQIFDWNDDGKPELFLNITDEDYNGDILFGWDEDGDFQGYESSGSFVSYDKDSCMLYTEFIGEGTQQYICSFDDNGLEERHVLIYSSDYVYYLDSLCFSPNDKAADIFNSYLAEYSLTEFSWSSPENLEEDLRNFYQTASVNENVKAKEYVPTAAEQEVIDAKNAYAEYIQEKFEDSEDYCKYALLNIDNDAIPEIYCEENSDTYLLSYGNGTVYEHYMMYGCSYIFGENKVYNSYGRMGEYGTEIFHLENGSVVLDLDGTFYEVIDDDGEWSGYEYYLSGVEISEEKYESTFENAFDSDSATTASAHLSYEYIMDYLQ